jgi:DNA polymerase-1
MMVENKKRLIIIDSNSLIHRAFHALPPLTTKKGELVNGVYGFLLVFLKALKEFKPDFVVSCFDAPGPTLRHKEYKEYKAKRPKAPQELYQQIPKVKEVLKAFGVPIFQKQGFEADDLIGAISRQAPRKQVFPKIETIILSGDLDTLQLVDENTKVYTLRKGVRDAVLYDIEKVKEKYQGLTPSQLVDFKALRGDPSDNIPGVTGIGEKTAIQLIKEFGSLENLYQELEKETEKSKKIKQSIRKKLKDYREQAFISKKLAQIQSNVPIEFKLEQAKIKAFSKEAIAQVFKKFEFYTLLKRLTEIKGEKKLKAKSTISFAPAQARIEDEIEKLYEEGVFSQKIYQVEKNLVPIVKKMEENGIKVDLKALKALSEYLAKRIEKIERKIFQLAGITFNLNSPSQVAEVLFEKLKIPIKDLKKTPGGAVSTGAQELKKIKKAHPIVNLILKHRELFKLKSGFVDSLPKMINPKDGKIHPHFRQLGTETGRMSCSEPNLQNIPIRGEIGKEIRNCFCAQTGFKFLSADYSQMELRIAASLSGDKKMQELFKKGEDIHTLTASQIFKIPKEKVTERMREIAKTLNFGVLYGMGPKAFSERTGMSLGEAKEFIEKYFQNFKELAEFVEGLIKKARQKGYAETLFGRKRFLPEINSIDPKIRAGAERMACNMPIQGTAADICKIAMIRLKERGIINGDCKLILQIHDELLFEVKQDKIETVVPKIKKIMEEVAKLEVPLRIDLKVGKSWGKLARI